MEADEREARATKGDGVQPGVGGDRRPVGNLDPQPLPTARRPVRFHGSVTLDALLLPRDAEQLAGEVVQHLTKLPKAKVSLSLEITAEVPAGFPEDAERTVKENCAALRFRQSDFERD